MLCEPQLVRRAGIAVVSKALHVSPQRFVIAQAERTHDDGRNCRDLAGRLAHKATSISSWLLRSLVDLVQLLLALRIDRDGY